jgi:hypothetical protein
MGEQKRTTFVFNIFRRGKIEKKERAPLRTFFSRQQDPLVIIYRTLHTTERQPTRRSNYDNREKNSEGIKHTKKKSKSHTNFFFPFFFLFTKRHTKQQCDLRLQTDKQTKQTRYFSFTKDNAHNFLPPIPEWRPFISTF